MLKRLVNEGWTLRKEGHKIRAYCPCEGRACTTIAIPGTPRDSDVAAQRVARAAGTCPKDDDDPRRSLTGMDREQ